MSSFRYGVGQKAAFYASYFWYKLILPLETKSPRLALWGYEMVYTAHKFRNYEYCCPWKSGTHIIKTRFGEFKIRAGTADAANVSPAFERRDMNCLFRIIGRLCDAKKRVLFLDIGGDIGTYSIAVANRFGHADVHIVCFEPIPSSCELILDNISRNNAEEKVELIDAALMDEAQEDMQIHLNTLAPGSSGVSGEGEVVSVRSERLDDLMMDRIHEYDSIVMKIDVEGVEDRVLLGASKLLTQGIEVYLMVEDFIDRSIVSFLEESGWTFIGKYTEYNSWWRIG
ncbi:MAG: FkbM family methyltransferase [Pontiellaceae bacterium]|nr:FkbM family methyltransferase [Pontiellaceae bacterium]